MCGSIKDEILDLEGVCAQSIEYLKKCYPELLMKRYNLTELLDDPYLIIEQIGRNRGCVLKGGIIDTTRACTLFMNELRGMKIGAMSYERPEERDN